MSTHQLAPVDWKMGQPLLPEHLHAQENAIAGEARLRHLTNGLPLYGISKMCWDTHLLSKGCLRVDAMRLYTRQQQLLVDYPGNAYIDSLPLDFTPSTRAEVFYFVFQDEPLPSNNVTQPYHSELKRRLFKIVFSLQPSLTDEQKSFTSLDKVIEHGKLAEFVKDQHDCWRLSERFIPPLIQVGLTDFLKTPLSQLNVLLGCYLNEVHQFYQQQQLPEIRRFEIKHCINNLSQSMQYLANHLGKGIINGEINFHPYFLYDQLQTLNRNLSLLEGDWSIPLIQNYQHDNLHGTFKVIFRNIISHLKLRSRNNRSFELHLKDGCYQAVLPTTLSPLDNLYLIINSETSNKLSPHQLPCLSSYRRMPTLFQYALSGASLKPINHHSSTHYFGDNAQCFEIVKGEELNHIVNDRSIAFLAQPEFRDFTFYLFQQSEISTKTGAPHAASE